MTDDKEPTWLQDQVIDRLRPRSRWRGSRLHWYGPSSHGPGYRLHGEPLKRARYKLYTLDEYYVPNSRYYRDRHGTYVWMGTDCGWEWLATRPGIYGTWLSIPFWALHDHVHTPQKKK